MNTIPYEILIRGSNGQLLGCHVIDTHGADARPITPVDLAALAPAINASAIAQRDAITAEFAAYKDAASKAATAIKSVITDPSIDDAGTVSAIAQLVESGERNANSTQRERELSEAQAALVAAQEKIAALNA